MTSQHIHRNHSVIAATWKEEKIRRLSDKTKKTELEWHSSAWTT